MNDRELLALLRALSRIGGPLANALGPQFGQGMGAVGGGLGLAGGIASGNPMQAVGGAAQLGGNIASLAGMPGLSQALGSVGGPLGLISALMNGNPGGAISALPATAAAASNAGAAAGLVSPALAGSVGTIAAGLAPAALMLMPAFVDTGGADMFDSLFGGVKSQAQKQVEEYTDYAQRFPGLVVDRARGAGLMDTLKDLPPDQLENALSLATKGVRATDLSPAYSHLTQPAHEGKSTFAANIPGMDLSGWEAIAPELEGKNWASFVSLLDKATNAGMDVNQIAGDRNRQMWTGNASTFVTPDGMVTDQDPNGKYSQSAFDLSNAIAGVGQQLGINWGARGDERNGQNQGYTVYDDQLGTYGFEPGKQGAALLKYLTKIDPGVTQHANWQKYRDALGVTDDMLQAIPDYTIALRDRPMNPLEATAFQAPDGGG